MAIQQEIGDKGEQLAVNYLKSKGFSVLEKNYRVGKSEIDIICKKDNLLVFVEVKTRSSIKFGHPESFVGGAKANKVIEGAEAYLFEKNWHGSIRFDIVSILTGGDNLDVKHFEDAFY